MGALTIFVTPLGKIDYRWWYIFIVSLIWILAGYKGFEKTFQGLVSLFYKTQTIT